MRGRCWWPDRVSCRHGRRRRHRRYAAPPWSGPHRGLACSTLGGLILLAGIAMAISKADSTGDQYASVTASVAGLLMTVIGNLVPSQG
ncbi:hypothetical protein [Kitasatospora sp. NPDC018614]|uniref:TRADD-N-associated membrane domain-containing protein n=1 Tax=Streptomycetaceae TaxID=2062 RepID=UPI00379DEC42